MRMVSALAAVFLAALPLAATGAAAEERSAVFAGGCFWCVEDAFDHVAGVTATTSGYTGGTLDNPSYEQVSAGGTGHFEAVKVDYDPAKVSYAQLLDAFWHNVDPFDARGQFCDKGSQYRAAIFTGDAEEKALAEASKAKVAARFEMPVATQILPAAKFYPAEDYHQNYHVTHAARYKLYKFGCGRPQRLEAIWGAPAS
jgi:peptide-methionine (S)-S-oxide reductase